MVAQTVDDRIAALMAYAESVGAAGRVNVGPDALAVGFPESQLEEMGTTNAKIQLLPCLVGYSNELIYNGAEFVRKGLGQPTFVRLDRVEERQRYFFGLTGKFLALNGIRPTLSRDADDDFVGDVVLLFALIKACIERLAEGNANAVNRRADLQAAGLFTGYLSDAGWLAAVTDAE